MSKTEAYQKIAQELINWYELNKRDLPWRKTTEAYKIWLSEIILQQTRVNQGLPYYNNFVEHYPRVEDLANAPEEEVLRLWQGLGYYSRARNLMFTANTVVNEYNGSFPTDFATLKQLKGVGDYTAAAIASFSSNESVPVVDGNVYRVIARLLGEYADISIPKTKKVFFEHAQNILPERKASVFNQAIMEFGALHCTPKNPNCQECKLKDICYANIKSVQQDLPVKTKKLKVKKRYLNYLILEQDAKLYLNKRETKDIWQSLFDFYLIESKTENKNDNILLEQLQSEQPELKIQEVEKITETYTHKLSHQTLLANFWKVKIKGGSKNILKNFHSINEVKNLPKPVLINKVLEEFYF